ncbi:MAG: glycosyltransferase [Candidatus Brocadiia bacterium]
MRCLVLTDVFPNRLRPWRGPYNRRQFECLARHCALTVVNPIPWTDLLGRPWTMSLLRGVDRVLDGIPIYHPVLWHVPKLGRGRTWRGALGAARRTVARRGLGPFDLVVATFAYPHGVAAMHLARELGVPYALKTRGSDLHSLPESGPQRALVADAMREAACVVAVSANLANIATELGADAARVNVLPNGVDADRFAVMPRSEARRRLGVDDEGPLVLYVGALRRVKGPDVLAEAADLLDEDVRVCLAGDGPMRSKLRSSRLCLLGHLPRELVVLWMNAADVVVLPSRNEGCPNVVLEAMACGTPVVAARVGAVPDLLDDGSGIVVPPENARALAQALKQALCCDWDREAIRSGALGMSWEHNGRQLFRILSEALGRVAPQAEAPAGGPTAQAKDG